jgi:uncharacterized protein
VLEGVVTNVAAFGAFVDVGVHQDGLVHVSAMSRQFVSDPRDVVKSGEVVRVKVLEVDEARKRISLTLRLDDEPGAAAKPERSGARREPGGEQGQGDKGGRRTAQGRGEQGRSGEGRGKPQDRRAGRSGQQGRSADRGRAPSPAANNAMADALRRAGFDTGGEGKAR